MPGVVDGPSARMLEREERLRIRKFRAVLKRTGICGEGSRGPSGFAAGIIPGLSQ